MKQKFFFYLVIFFVNTIQCMNITSSLHNLEKKLIQLKPFLAGKEPQEDFSTLLQQFESHINSIKQYAKNIDTNFGDLLNNPKLEDMQIDASGKPLNTIAQEAAQKIRLIWENYKNVESNIQTNWEILAKIGDYFKRDLLTENQKIKLISIITEFKKQTNILKSIASQLKEIDLKIFQNLTFQATAQNVPVVDFIDSLKNRFYILYSLINFSSSSIKELIENNTISIKKDIEEFKEGEQQIQNIYKQISQLFKQIKESGIPGKEAELNQKYEDFKYINLAPFNLIYLISVIKNYIPFLKDPTLKKELLTIMQSPNLKFADKYKQEMDKLGVPLPKDIKDRISDIFNLFKNLESITQETESILK